MVEKTRLVNCEILMKRKFIKSLIFRDYSNNDCCKDMTFHLDRKDCHVGYDKVFREYFLRTHSDSTIQAILFCPWCSKELPQSLRGDWFSILEDEYEIVKDQPQKARCFEIFTIFELCYPCSITLTVLPCGNFSI